MSTAVTNQDKAAAQELVCRRCSEAAKSDTISCQNGPVQECCTSEIEENAIAKADERARFVEEVVKTLRSMKRSFDESGDPREEKPIEDTNQLIDTFVRVVYACAAAAPVSSYVEAVKKLGGTFLLGGDSPAAPWEDEPFCGKTCQDSTPGEHRECRVMDCAQSWMKDGQQLQSDNERLREALTITDKLIGDMRPYFADYPSRSPASLYVADIDRERARIAALKTAAPPESAGQFCEEIACAAPAESSRRECQDGGGCESYRLRAEGGS